MFVWNVIIILPVRLLSVHRSCVEPRPTSLGVSFRMATKTNGDEVEKPNHNLSGDQCFQQEIFSFDTNNRKQNDENIADGIIAPWTDWNLMQSVLCCHEYPL